HLSGKDALTGLANRAWFEERLEEEMSRARRSGQPLSLGVLDLDSFREMNSAHGHPGGDLALQTVARRLRQSIRKSDLAARLGGDECVIVFPDTDVAQAVLRLESLREAVADLRVQAGRTAFSVTMSAGVASFPADGTRIADVLAAADARAFEAKHRGKNRVVGPERIPGPSSLAAARGAAADGSRWPKAGLADRGCGTRGFRACISDVTREGPDPGAPEKEIFPALTAAQIARLALLGRERAFEVDEILFEQGGTNRPLMVVLEGEIEILSDRDTLVTVHRPGNFSGDVDLIAGHPAVVRARARRAGRVLEVPAERVRTLVMTDPELSQIFLRAFILRRALLMTRNAGNVV